MKSSYVVYYVRNDEKKRHPFKDIGSAFSWIQENGDVGESYTIEDKFKEMDITIFIV